MGRNPDFAESVLETLQQGNFVHIKVYDRAGNNYRCDLHFINLIDAFIQSSIQ